MIPVSDAYKELVKSNIRPKAEPIIKVSGKDNNGNDIELIWRAKNIKDLTYKRSIDPVGRELPYMELTWTEIYTGKLNEESYPEKYNNVTQYMAVELSFIQDLGFYNTWKTIFNSGTTWKELFSKNSTWKQIKNNVSQEVITMPKLFLSARPTISGQTITWVAKDFLNLLNNPVLDDLNPVTLEVPFFNPLDAQMQESAYVYYQNISTIFNVLIQSMENVVDFASYRNKMLKKRIIAENTVLKQFILNYLNLGNFVITFKLDGSFEINEFGLIRSISKLFLKRNMYNPPNIQKISNISVYDFKNYLVEMDESANYTKSYTDTLEGYWYRFLFNKYGTVLPDYNNGEEILHELTYALSLSPDDIVVTPLNFNGYDNELNSGLIGEIYTENNPLNPFGSNDEESQERFELLKGYFNSNAIVADFETLPDFSVEPYDSCNFETNLFQSSEELVKLGIVISSEISYNGAWKEKFIVHDATYLPKG